MTHKSYNVPRKFPFHTELNLNDWIDLQAFWTEWTNDRTWGEILNCLAVGSDESFWKIAFKQQHLFFYFIVNKAKGKLLLNQS